MRGDGTNQNDMATADLISAYRMRWKRRRYLWRAFRRRQEFTAINRQTNKIEQSDILLFMTVRNEALRLPHFIDYYRALGVDHFLIVDNASNDGTAELLADQPDVSLWRTDHSYKASRFGMDWLTALQFKYAPGHWALTVDADELLVFPSSDHRSLRDLTGYLDQQKLPMFGALMLDMYPKGPIAAARYSPKTDPIKTISWFDGPPFRSKRQEPMRNLWVQGGARDRMFFIDTPANAPTLNKIPLVKWRSAYVYINSTHSMLPPKLNAAYENFAGEKVIAGALLHTKFLNTAPEKAAEEKQRRQHFGKPEDFDAYYDAVSANPDLWHEGSIQYEGPAQLESLGIMSRGDWV